MIQLPADHLLYDVARNARRVAVVAGLLCVLGFVLDPTQLARSYLVAWVYWTGAALGALAILMIYHVTGGAWGTTIRRVLEAAIRLLPVLALLFVPIAVALPQLYVWARPEAAADPLLRHKAPYLNVPFFLARTVGYFVAWILVSRALLRWSDAQDATTDARPTERLELISRGGLLLLGLTMTFASIDWMMSLEPHWSSTIYGIVFMGGTTLTAMSFGILFAALARPGTRLPDAVSAGQFHDLGKLLLAFVMLWAYFNFSQFLITWSGNLPEEIPWYLERTTGGWRAITIAIVLFHFALPFVILLSRRLKRNPAALGALAAAFLLVRYLDVYWLLVPAFGVGAMPHWLDVATFLAIGGAFVALEVRALAGRPLLPLHDPSLMLPEEIG